MGDTFWASKWGEQGCHSPTKHNVVPLKGTVELTSVIRRL